MSMTLDQALCDLRRRHPSGASTNPSPATLLRGFGGGSVCDLRVAVPAGVAAAGVHAWRLSASSRVGASARRRWRFRSLGWRTGDRRANGVEGGC